MSETDSPCQSCGACCGYSENWPRFTLEEDAALALIPASYINARASGMRCEGNRCIALNGVIGDRVACVIYAVRPDVCRECQPGDDECTLARRRFGLAELAA